MEENNGIGFALGGLAGNNAHGAGFLQAALDKSVVPEMISCTSGQLLWVWRYLRLLNNDKGVSGDGTLETRFKDELLSPLGLIFDAFLPAKASSTPLGEFQRRTADWSQQWPLARDFIWLWLAFFGKKRRYKPSFDSIFPDALRNWDQAMDELRAIINEGNLGSVFLVEFLANMWPNRLLTPDFEPSFFQDISETFNMGKFGDKEIGIVFNSYDPMADCEFIHINEVARKKLGREYGTPSSYRPNTQYARIDLDAVRSALWLYMYGFDRGARRLDGAYYRDVILSELCIPTIRRIFAVRPMSSQWIGSLPTTWTGSRDLETEVSFNGAYIGERDNIDLMNKVIAELRQKQKEPGDPLSSKKIDEFLDKYHEVKVIPVDMDTQRGFFDYVFEDMETFNQSKNKSLTALREVM